MYNAIEMIQRRVMYATIQPNDSLKDISSVFRVKLAKPVNAFAARKNTSGALRIPVEKDERSDLCGFTDSTKDEVINMKSETVHEHKTNGKLATLRQGRKPHQIESMLNA